MLRAPHGAVPPNRAGTSCEEAIVIRIVQRSIPAIVLSLAAAAVPSAAPDRAQDVLARARTAMFGQASQAAITSLVITASVKRVVQSIGAEMTSAVELEFLLPDTYRRTENISVSGMTRRISTGLRSEAFFYDDGGAAAAAGMDPTAPGRRRDDAIKELRADRFRWLTLFLLAPPAVPGLTVTSAGAVEVPEGHMDVVDVKGDAGLNLRLFFDATNHRLMLATFQVESIDPRQATLPQQKVIQQAQSGQVDPKNVAQVLQEEMAKLPKAMLSVRMRFSEPKTMGGLTVPTKISTDGAPQGPEEWTVSGVKINVPVTFDK